MLYIDCHVILSMSHGYAFSQMQDCCARAQCKHSIVDSHFPPNFPQEGGAATHTNESLSEMLDRLARDRSDGLDLDLSERFDKETALPPFPSSTSRIGKASLCSLSHLYGMVNKALFAHLLAR